MKSNSRAWQLFKTFLFFYLLLLFSNSKLIRFSFSDSKLIRASFSDSKFIGTSLSNSKLVRTSFAHSELVRTSFPNPKLVGAAFPHSELVRVPLESCWNLIVDCSLLFSFKVLLILKFEGLLSKGCSGQRACEEERKKP